MASAWHPPLSWPPGAALGALHCSTPRQEPASGSLRPVAADLPAASTVTLPPLHAHIPAEAELAYLAGPTAGHLSLEEQLRLAGVSLRMLNLPFVVCASASGLPFFLPLNKVGWASLCTCVL